MEKKHVRSEKRETVACRTRREWIEKIRGVIQDAGPERSSRSYFWGDNYLNPYVLASVLSRLSSHGLTALPIELKPEAGSHQHYSAASELVEEAVDALLRDRIGSIRDRAKHGNVESQIEILIGELGLFQCSPASIGTSLNELDALKRQGYVARVKRTLDKLKAVSHRNISNSLFTAMGKAKGMIKDSGASARDLGFDSFVDLEEMLQTRARTYIKRTLDLQTRNDWKSRRVLKICETYALTEESLGLETGTLAREIAEWERVDAEERKQAEALPPSRAEVKRVKSHIMEQLRRNRDPESKEYQDSMKYVRSNIAKFPGTLEELGTTEAELVEFEKTEKLRDARHLAYLYARGKCIPSYLFKKLDELKISPEQVGVDPRERSLIPKAKN